MKAPTIFSRHFEPTNSSDFFNARKQFKAEFFDIYQEAVLNSEIEAFIHCGKFLEFRVSFVVNETENGGREIIYANHS